MNTKISVREELHLVVYDEMTAVWRSLANFLQIT